MSKIGRGAATGHAISYETTLPSLEESVALGAKRSYFLKKANMAAPEIYSKTQIYLHWSIVLLVAFQIFSGGAITELWADRMDATIANEPSANPHAFVGLFIFALMIWRVIVRLRNGAPSAPQNEHPLLVLASKTSHGLFYVILLAMPISGAAAWFFGLEQPANLHALTRFLLIPLIAIHAVAALSHHFWFKTNVLKRMLGIKD